MNVILKHKKIRSWQDSNLRSQREYDFKSDALTTRPQLPDSLEQVIHIELKDA